jgi:TolB-like protein
LENFINHNRKKKHRNQFFHYIFKINLLELALLIFLLSSSAFSEKKSIAVSDLEGTLEKKELSVMTERMVSELTKDTAFIVLERSQMTQILKEQGFQQTGCTSTDCAVQVGQLLGVQTMIAGSIGKVGKIYSISLRMIDVQTGRINSSASIDVTGSIEEVLKRGIPQVVHNLISGDVIVQSKFNIRKFAGISCIVAGAGAAGSSAYLYIQKNKYRKDYDNSLVQSDFDYNFGKEKNAYYGFIGTAIGAAVMVPVSYFLLRKSGKENKSDKAEPSVSLFVNGHTTGLMVSLNF